MQRTVQVTGVISPVSLVDTYPVIDPAFGIDGLRCVGSLNEMYNIPISRRRGGMIVGVQNNTNNTTDYYTLKTGVTWSVGTPSIIDWTPFGGTNSATASLPIKYNISNESITVPINYEYLLYGDLIIGTGGSLNNYGKTVIINGNIILQGSGTYSNSGEIDLVTLSTKQKFSYSFSLGYNATMSIVHSLSTSDIIYNIRDGNNFVYPNVEILDSNSVMITTTGTISSGRINIIG
jgi:hypothetical protein